MALQKEYMIAKLPSLDGLPFVDIAAFAVFLVLWFGYTLWADWVAKSEDTLTAVMVRHRRTWMRSMCERENRISDAALVGTLMHSVAFLASTSMLVLGGLMALMGAGERAFAVYREMPFAIDSTQESFEMKVVLLAVIFVYAFFQFTWSLRQFNYCCIIMGAAPGINDSAAVKDAFSIHAARLQSLGAQSFNRGLRAFYFALAMILWFVHASVFLVATAVVLAVLYRREFRSKSLRALADLLDRP